MRVVPQAPASFVRCSNTFAFIEQKKIESSELDIEMTDRNNQSLGQRLVVLTALVS